MVQARSPGSLVPESLFPQPIDPEMPILGTRDHFINRDSRGIGWYSCIHQESLFLFFRTSEKKIALGADS
jgi:hypothetical protein